MQNNEKYLRPPKKALQKSLMRAKKGRKPCVHHIKALPLHRILHKYQIN
jgi:hypothetical protein